MVNITDNGAGVHALGISLTLSPEDASRLRQGKVQKQPEQLQEDEEREQDTHQHKNGSLHDSKNDAANHHLPVVAIELERLVGYQPPVEEVNVIRSELIMTMWSRHSMMSQDERKGQELETPTKAMSIDVDKTRIPPPDFDQQVAELLDMKIATFYRSQQEAPTGTTVAGAELDGMQTVSSTSSSSSIVIVPYPPKVLHPETRTLIETKQLWQDLQRRRFGLTSTSVTIQLAKERLSIPSFLDRLWTYLEQCSRGLFWKSEMSIELQRLIREEQLHKDYLNWQQVERKGKLDKLYQVRETLIYQLELHTIRLDALEKDRDERVAMELRKQRAATASLNPGVGTILGGLEAFDFESSSAFAFPSEFQWQSLVDDPYESEEEDWGLQSDQDEYESDRYSNASDNYKSDDGYDEIGNPQETQQAEGNDGDVNDHGEGTTGGSDEHVTNSHDAEDGPVQVPNDTDEFPESKNIQNDHSTEPLEHPATDIVTPFEKRKARKKAKKKERQEQRAAEQEVEYQARFQQALAKQNEVKDLCTTPDLIMAQALHKALQDKMDKVEDLLESLQEEAGKEDEEEEGHQSSNSSPAKLTESSIVSFSLLDQILAMILGTLPPTTDSTSKEEHYRFIQKEHEKIVKEWKEYFGRLPPASASSQDRDQDDDQNDTNNQNGKANDDVDNGNLVVHGDNEVKFVEKASSTITDAQQKRLDLGITDNLTEDWDEVENWDEYIHDSTGDDAFAATAATAVPVATASLSSPSATTTTIKQETKDIGRSMPVKPKVGLRPGGKARS